MKCPSADKYKFKFIINRCDECINELNMIKGVEPDYKYQLDDGIGLIKLLKNILTPLQEDAERECEKDKD